MQFRKFWLSLVLVAILLGVAAFLTRPPTPLEESQANMLTICVAVHKFQDANQRLPGSFGEVVAAGLLPEFSVIYRDPTLVPKERATACRYDKSDYRLECSPTEFTIGTETYYLRVSARR